MTPNNRQSNLDVLDELISHFVESQCLQPTFLIDYPVVNSPLAKKHRSKEGVTERFELFLASMEICNAYTELNDPLIQQKNFDAQEKVANPELKLKENETNYVKALEYGLPPCAGWGMGIDRITMLLTGKTSIREVIIFPTLK